MKKILIVDDSHYICGAIKLMLDIKGFETEVAYDGESALEKVQKDIFDLVILDLMMPGIGGVKVYNELKKHKETKNIKIIVLTAKVDAMEKEPDLKDVDVFMPKPFDKNELVEAIGKLLQCP